MFNFLKKIFSNQSSVKPIDELIKLNKNSTQAFLEGDNEHYNNVDKMTYKLFSKLNDDFVCSIAETTPEGKFMRFKGNVSNDQVQYVTNQIKKAIQQVKELDEVNQEAKQLYIQSSQEEKEHKQLFKELDEVFLKLSNMDEKSLQKSFSGKKGEEFVQGWIKSVNSQTFRNILEKNNPTKEDWNEYTKENHPDLIEINKKYGLNDDYIFETPSEET